jgi:RNA polymerase sigma-70 factor (ECF subfamily)
MASDEELMLACGRGTAGAFEELFGRYRQPIWGYFRRRLDDPARAEELAQDTFVAVLKNAKRYEVRASFRTYLYGIAANLLAAERRRPVYRELGPPAGQLPAGPASAADAGHVIRDAVSRLEAREREILMLREFEQLTYGEIADVLDVPINTVRSRLFRARGELRQLLESQS